VNAPNCIRASTLRQWAASARELIEKIEASGRSIPPHLQEPYAKACGTVEQVEAAVADQSLGVIPVLFWAVPAIGALIAGGVVLYRVSEEITSATRQTVKATGNALSMAAYALVGVMVYSFARKRVA